MEIVSIVASVLAIAESLCAKFATPTKSAAAIMSAAKAELAASKTEIESAEAKERAIVEAKAARSVTAENLPVVVSGTSSAPVVVPVISGGTAVEVKPK